MRILPLTRNSVALNRVYLSSRVALEAISMPIWTKPYLFRDDTSKIPARGRIRDMKPDTIWFTSANFGNHYHPFGRISQTLVGRFPQPCVCVGESNVYLYRLHNINWR